MHYFILNTIIVVTSVISLCRSCIDTYCKEMHAFTYSYHCISMKKLSEVFDLLIGDFVLKIYTLIWTD